MGKPTFKYIKNYPDMDKIENLLYEIVTLEWDSGMIHEFSNQENFWECFADRLGKLGYEWEHYE